MCQTMACKSTFSEDRSSFLTCIIIAARGMGFWFHAPRKVPGMRLYVKPQTADLPLIDQKLAKKLALVDFHLASRAFHVMQGISQSSLNIRLNLAVKLGQAFRAENRGVVVTLSNAKGLIG